MSKSKASINKRDKDLLLILAFIIIAFLIYYVFMSPALANRSLLQQDLEEAKAEYARAEAVVQKLPELRKDEENKLEELSEKYKQFFYEVNEERILYKLDSLFVSSGLPMNTLAISRLSAWSVGAEEADYSPTIYPLLELAAKSNETLITDADNGVDTNKTDNSKSKAIPKDAAAYSDFSIVFSSASYESAYNFIKAVEDLDRTIIIKNITMKDSKDGGGVDGEIGMSVYSIAKPNEADNNDITFNPILPKGKPDPFSQ